LLKVRNASAVSPSALKRIRLSCCSVERLALKSARCSISLWNAALPSKVSVSGDVEPPGNTADLQGAAQLPRCVRDNGPADDGD